MRLFLFSLLVGIVPTFAALSNPLWESKPRPKTCQTETVQVLAIDTSGSMQNERRFLRVQQQLIQFVRSQSLNRTNCQHLILIRFDTTADVVADEYLVNAANRDRLVAALSKLKPIGEQTNFDEAAKQIRLAWMQLVRSTGTPPQSLRVWVLTDGQPEPSEGKTSFDLMQFLQREFGEKTAFSWGTIRLTPQGATLRQALSDKKEREVSIKALPQILAAETKPAIAPTPAKSESPAIPTVQNPANRAAWPWLVGVPIALGAIWVVCLKHVKKPISTPSVSEIELSLNPVHHLLVTELGRDRTATPKKVFLSPGLPVKFGSKANYPYVIENLGTINVLFSITATSSGMVRLETEQALRCNDLPVPPAGLTLPGDRSFQINYEHRTWRIEPFAQTHAPKQPSYFIHAASN